MPSENSTPPEKERPNKFARRLKSTGRWLKTGLKPPVGQVLRSAAPREGISFFKSLRKPVSSFLKFIRADRSVHAPGAPNLDDFAAVLACWGIEPDDESIKRCIHGLKIRCACMCGMAVGFSLSVSLHWSGRTSQVLVLLSSGALILVSLTTHAWRVRVLKTKRFILFRTWLFGG